MNCPSCKNPNNDNSTECEWCGNEIISNPRFKIFEDYETGSYIDNQGTYTVGDGVYQPLLVQQLSDYFETYNLQEIEIKCQQCNIWNAHHFYGKYECGLCGYKYIHNNK